MNVRTIEQDFEYQANNIFESLVDDYKEEMEVRQAMDEPTDTFSNWLWSNLDELGRTFYETFDDWAGMDETTSKFDI